jgi:AraC-like DNA-binding protein
MSAIGEMLPAKVPALAPSANADGPRRDADRRVVACDIDIRFFRPPADLEACITTFYRMDFTVPGGGRALDWLQPEWAGLRYFSGSLPDCRIPGGGAVSSAAFVATGPSSRPGRFELGTSRMWGVGLFPLGWAQFIGKPAAAFANALLDGAGHPAFSAFAPLGSSLFQGPPDDKAEYALLVDFFRTRTRKLRDEAAIRAVHAAIVDTDMASVTELAKRAGLTSRSLERLCARHFGFPPKLLLRRQRLMRTLAAFMTDPGASWSKVIDGRYHDQAHFVREFQQFMLMSPTEYAALPHPLLAGFMAERKRILGTPAQTLDHPSARDL